MHADAGVAGVAGVAAAAPARAAPLAADGLASAENAIDTHTHSQPVEKKNRAPHGYTLQINPTPSDQNAFLSNYEL